MTEYYDTFAHLPTRRLRLNNKQKQLKRHSINIHLSHPYNRSLTLTCFVGADKA